MISQRAAQLGTSIGASDWPHSDIGDERLFVWNFRVSDLELEGWHLVSSKWNCLPTDVCMGRSTWQHSASQTEDLLLVQSYECPSRSVAHETLLELLSQFQVPLELQQTSAGRIGMLFIDHGETSALLNVGNVVVRITTGDGTAVPAGQLADAIAERLGGRPPIDEPGTKRAPQQLAVGASSELGVPASTFDRSSRSDEEAGPAMRVFTRHGDVAATDDDLVFVAAESGTERLECYSTGADGSSCVTMELEVGDS